MAVLRLILISPRHLINLLITASAGSRRAPNGEAVEALLVDLPVRTCLDERINSALPGAILLVFQLTVY